MGLGERCAHSLADWEAVQGSADPREGSAFALGQVGTSGVLSRAVVCSDLSFSSIPPTAAFTADAWRAGVGVGGPAKWRDALSRTPER